MTERVDTHEGLYWIAAAIGALIVALAVMGVLDMDDTKTNLPPEPAVYQHPEGP